MTIVIVPKPPRARGVRNTRLLGTTSLALATRARPGSRRTLPGLQHSFPGQPWLDQQILLWAVNALTLALLEPHSYNERRGHR
eukprot:996754-Amphidinium_carterae.1